MRLLCSDLKYVLFRELFPQITKMVEKAPTGADPGFFIGGGALVSCSTSTPINHIVFFFCRIPAVLENRRSSQWVAHPLHPPPRSAPVQWYYSDESPSFAHTIHLWSTCTYPKWLSDWPARENNGIFYGEIVMYTSVNISHQDVTFFIVLYSQTTFCFPFLS